MRHAAGNLMTAALRYAIQCQRGRLVRLVRWVVIIGCCGAALAQSATAACTSKTVDGTKWEA